MTNRRRSATTRSVPAQTPDQLLELTQEYNPNSPSPPVTRACTHKTRWRHVRSWGEAEGADGQPSLNSVENDPNPT